MLSASFAVHSALTGKHASQIKKPVETVLVCLHAHTRSHIHAHVRTYTYAMDEFSLGLCSLIKTQSLSNSLCYLLELKVEAQ